MDNAKIMTDAEKTQQMCDFSKRLAVRMGAFEKQKQELADAESQRKKAQVFRDDVISKVVVTSDLGWKFAEKYSMDINGSVGQYIEKLNNIKYAKMTLQQKQMVLTILFAGLFYGAYEYFSDIKDQGKFNAEENSDIDVIGQDVEWVKQHIVPALEYLDKGNNSINLYREFNSKRSDMYRLSRNGAGLRLGDYESYLWYLARDTERMLVGGDNSRIVGAYFIREYPIDYPYSVNDVNHFVSALRGCGDQYTIAPAINLWAGRFEASLNGKINAAEGEIAKMRSKFTTKEQEIAELYDLLAQNSATVQLLEKGKKK